MCGGEITTVRLFGKLHTYRRQKGLSPIAEIWLPDEGMPAVDVARQLDLPLDFIEGVFCNHVVYGLDHILRPGDELAFVPTGIPGPHRFMLGIHAAGKSKSD
ncbi:MAG: MoaD/ThiS family protein [Desulfuromonas sp.]|nr:MoaD/ThiS family protein [Desulfuromonas sp.]